MTDEGISRRQVLRAASVAGGLGIASGAGTQALLGDREVFSGNTVGAGTLDLLVASGEGVDPETWLLDQPSLDSEFEGPISLEKECGTIGLAFTVCGNPGTVELSASTDQSRDDDDDHDHHEEFQKKWKHWKESFSHDYGNHGRGVGKRTFHGGPPKFVHDWKKDPFVTLYTGDCEHGRVIAAGELSTVLDDLSEGVPLHPNCSRLKIEGEDIEDGQIELDDGNVTVTIDTITDDGETVGVDLTAIEGASLCQVNVKGGGKPFPEPCEIPNWATYPWECTGKSFWEWWLSKFHDRKGRKDSKKSTGSVKTGVSGDDHWWQSYGKRIGVKPYYFDCESSAEGLRTRNDGDTEVSHIELFICDDRCFDCTPEQPFPLFLQWAGLEEQTPIDITLETSQCRHSSGGEQ